MTTTDTTPRRRRRTRAKYLGCSIDAPRGRLRLRFRWQGKPCAISSGLLDSPETRHALERVRRRVAASLEAGIDPRPALHASFAGAKDADPGPLPVAPTVASYFEQWIVDKVPPEVRRAQAKDYRRHLRGYVLPTLGERPLVELGPRDILGLRAELRQRGLSLKFVKNILAGSLKAMCRDARRIDHVLAHDPFEGVTWPRVELPAPDPFTAEERRRILAWFRDKRFGFHPGEGTSSSRRRLHPPYHAFVHLLFWTGVRPSEAAGLQAGDVDLERGGLEVRRSRHLYEDSAPKTTRAHRHVELLPETVRVLRAIVPLRVAPTSPVFVNTVGRQLEPRAFLPHWYACLRALGIRPRGIYSCKDTYISTVLPLKPIPWIEEQTGVTYATLKKHYGRWLPQRRDDAASRALDTLARMKAGELCTASTTPRTRARMQRRDPSSGSSDLGDCRGGESNP